MGETINVVGMGYIGLPTALILASNGVTVFGSDIDTEKIRILETGSITFDEKGLNDLFNKARDNGIHFCNNVVEADIYIIAVPTPFNKLNKKIDAQYLLSAVKKILECVKKTSIIVVESTISPGTIDRYVRPLVETKNIEMDGTIAIAHAPERIIPGNMIAELKNNNRTIGADDRYVAEHVRSIYSLFCKGEILLTDIRTAELSKVVENAYRDINIAYANELVKICQEADVNVNELIAIANRHPRVHILTPGPGVGGHCISVDPWFLVGDYPGLANIVLAARQINDSMPEYVLKRIRHIMDCEKIDDVRRVGLYGLTYKENVDDIRESPTLQLLKCMHDHLADGIKVYDPHVKTDIVSGQYHSFEKFLQNIDMVVIMVGHEEIKSKFQLLNEKVIFDTRNIIPTEKKYTL